ncbi:hypothetical protein, partial [Burkholderia ubonensis]|uniref:hypothetical protein n=2 Tax=Burkholderia ubonensis TaxID=101571 RepID=UPI001E6413B0
MRKRRMMDISLTLENTGIGSLRGVHLIGRKSGQNDLQSAHLSPQVSHGRKRDKAGLTTMLEHVRPLRVKAPDLARP